MPVVKFFIPDNIYAERAVRGLLEEASLLYVELLYPDQNPKPLSRVRALVIDIVQSHWATAGETIDSGGVPAPIFEFLVLEGRSDAQIAELLEGFTRLISKHLQCAVDQVRGMAIPIHPAHWAIGGVPAIQIRQSEISRRKMK